MLLKVQVCDATKASFMFSSQAQKNCTEFVQQ